MNALTENCTAVLFPSIFVDKFEAICCFVFQLGFCWFELNVTRLRTIEWRLSDVRFRICDYLFFFLLGFSFSFSLWSADTFHKSWLKLDFTMELSCGVHCSFSHLIQWFLDYNVVEIRWMFPFICVLSSLGRTESECAVNDPKYVNFSSNFAGL